MNRLRSTLRLSVAIAGILATQGCATGIFPAISALGSAVTLTSWMSAPSANRHVRQAGQNGVAGPEAESYRQGIRDTLARLQRNGGLPVVASPGPPDSFHYVSPVMQEVWMPAQIVGGMLVPAHHEWVVVRPGTWQLVDGSTSPAQATAPPRGKRGPF